MAATAASRRAAARAAWRGVDRDLASLLLRNRVRWLRQRDCQHAVPELCRHLLGIDLVRDRHCPLKGAVGTFHTVKRAVIRLALFVMFGSLFALDAELVTNDRYLDVTFFDARQFRR